MSILSLNGRDLKKFLRGGAEGIRENIEELNRIDKFPSDDKDTGRNMYMTINSVTEALMNDNSLNISYIASVASKAAIKNAKGNSGIILSQIIRGFEKAVDNNESIGAVEFAKCFHYAADFVNKTVLYKKGNTMCSLIKDVTNRIMDTCLVTDDIGEIMAAGVQEACDRLLMEEEADSGAKGLFYFFEGGMKAICRNPEYAVKKNSFDYTVKIALCENAAVSKNDTAMLFEGIGRVSEFTGENKFAVLTNYPYEVVEKTKGLDIKTVLIEKGIVEERAKKIYNFAVFSSDKGTEEIYNKTGIENVISDVSDEKACEIIESINADCVFVMADSRENYTRALKCCEKNENAIVIETKSMPEVIWAMTGFSEVKSTEDNKYSMTDCVMSVMTGMIEENDTESQERNYSLIIEDREVLSEKSSLNAVKKLVDAMLDERKNAGILAVFYGEDIYDDEINELIAFVSEKYRNIDIEIHRGGQHNYKYIIGVV